MTAHAYSPSALSLLVGLWATAVFSCATSDSDRSSFFPPATVYGATSYRKASRSPQAFNRAARDHVCSFRCMIRVFDFQFVNLDYRTWFPALPAKSFFNSLPAVMHPVPVPVPVSGLGSHDDSRTDSSVASPTVRFRRPANRNAPSGVSRPRPARDVGELRARQKRSRLNNNVIIFDSREGEISDEDGGRGDSDNEAEESVVEDNGEVEMGDAEPCLHRFDASKWPVVPSDERLAEILREYNSVTSNAAFQQVVCACCSQQLSRIAATEFPMAHLDFNVLEGASQCSTDGAPLTTFDTEGIDNDGMASFCPRCAGCIIPTPSESDLMLHSFTKVPVLARVNGLFIGNVPIEIARLTMVEKLCIARARASRCCIKLQGHGASHVSKGNVVILPQAASELARLLPLSATEIANEFVVIMVANTDQPITVDQIPKKLLTVRRDMILAALKWLQEHNPVYRDVGIDREALETYPVNGPLPVPTFDNIASASTAAEGSSYVPAAATDVERVASSHPASSSPTFSPPSTGAPVPAFHAANDAPISTLDVSGCMDSNNMSHVADSRKISAFMNIKNGGKFLVYPSGSTPMREWVSPDTFAALFPDLFPYGCGVFEDPLRPKKVPFAAHVKHLLKLKDRRFAMHTTFPFICLNIIQRRQSSYQASLQTSLPTFNHIAPLLEAVTVETLASIQAKLAKLKPGVRFNPETEAEKGATALLRKVTLMSSSMFGSVGSHRNMREELRALLRHSGMPSLFVTLNPADSMNFVVSVMAGQDVDLDERLGLGDDVKEEVSQRFSAASADHGACAEGFHFMVEKFIDVFLAYGSPEGGIFGKCLNHYGVVEAQGRGALHIHMLIWLEHAPSPLQLRENVKEDPEWAVEVCRWVDTVMSGSLPEGAVPSGRYPPCDDDALAFRQRGEHRSLPLLQPPPVLPPRMSEEDWQRVRQDVMEILECGQLHDHSFTCFKHLPKLRRAQKLGDADCRFKFPKEQVLHTHFNDDGTIDVKRTHPKLNMYNLIMVAAFRCNMDIKFVGSGMMAMAAVYYISNYISKVALDTPTMFAAIEARFRRGNGRLLGQEADRVGETGAEARQRQMKSLLIKSCNALTGKQELSSEQVVHHLLGYPHRYTNARFLHVRWWDIARRLSLSNSKLSEDAPAETDRMEESLDLDEMPRPTGGDVERTVTLLRMENPEDNLRHSGGSHTVDDYIRRPDSMSSVCCWDFLARYQKLTVKTARKKGPQKATEFLPSHPQFGTHRIQTRRTPVVPILSGPSIPRDSPASAEEHARTMLALFKPWRSPADLVPAEGSTSKEVYDAFLPSLCENHRAVIGHMQEHTQCLDAKDDWSRARRKDKDRAMEGMTEFGVDQLLEDDAGLEEDEWEQTMDQAFEDEIAILTGQFANVRTTSRAAIDACENNPKFWLL